MKQSKFDNHYLCIGIVHIPPIVGRISDCGVTHTLREWLELFYPDKDVLEFFKYDSEKEILSYLLDNADHSMIRVHEKFERREA